MDWDWDAPGIRPEIAWGGRRWAVAVAAPRWPGLVAEGERIGPALALAGLSARGRSVDERALGGASLIGHEARPGRVEAAYAPAGWGSLRVRATWTSRGDGVVDLEVQVQAFTVEEPGGLEVLVASRLAPAAGPAGLAAGTPGMPSLMTAGDGAAPPYYLEMVHPDDVAGPAPPRADGSRHALFGHDLERGVVVRGRLRGIWLDHRPDEAEVARRFDEFLREPLPLGT